MNNKDYKYHPMELYLKIMSDIKSIQDHYPNNEFMQKIVFAQYFVESILDLNVFWNGTPEGERTNGDSQLWEDVLEIMESKTKHNEPSK